MEDAATAEISRVQNWQWLLRHGADLDAGARRRARARHAPDLLARVLQEEMARVEEEVGAERFRKGRYAEAGKVFAKQCVAARSWMTFLRLTRTTSSWSTIPGRRHRASSEI
ncbi:hypothetical protein PR202_gb15231 [Eleusine coracana subsp. coracana]|uniref:Malate synthase C-terminal domain-containing protein n=1 Tax=Eleusine coracana subsp. coracana TaxID=191504 RepID=A0AAV5EX29_ELECO|nr:hypothetical protein PR202_gb15231 [Eleusine coracana subsp. coracana]